MNKFLLSCLFFVAWSTQLAAQSKGQKLSIGLSTGAVNQDLKWSIAGNLAGQNPNIFSELHWQKVGGQSVGTTLVWNIYKHLLLAGDYERVFIRSGTVTDQDFSGDNRSGIIYDERFNADKGHATDWSASAGYKLINQPKFNLHAFAGYRINRQSLVLYDQTGSFPNLNSTYTARWKGPFIKSMAAIELVKKLQVSASISYNQVNYQAISDWNLAQDFQHPISYRHTAKGFGITGDLGLTYAAYRHVAIHVSGGYFTWQTGKGIDELFLTSGSVDKTQLNRVDWSGYRATAGLILKL